MAYKNYTVQIIFQEQESGSDEYILPIVHSISDPKEGIKANVIKGTRSDGAIIIPAGKQSQEIVIKGTIYTEEGYADLSTKINELKANVTTNIATLTLRYWDSELSGGGGWVNTWSYSVRRIEPITFGESLRTESINYTATFLIINY